MIEYRYIDKNGKIAFCNLRVDPKVNLVYVEEHTDNQGSNIHDSAVQLANQVTEEFGLIKERLIWLENFEGYYMVEFLVYNHRLTGGTRSALTDNEVLGFLN